MHAEITVRFEEPEYSGNESDEMVEVCLIKEGDNSVDVQVILTPEELTPVSAEGTIFAFLIYNLCMNYI